MNRLSQCISSIQAFLAGSDLTNSEEHQALALEYNAFCVEYNRKAEECARLLERRMLTEATAYAREGSPSLEELDNMLLFPEREEFLELYVMYGWERPASLNTNVLKTLRNSAFEQKDLEPLLRAYRQIARSEETETKVELLRKIVALSKNPGEWKTVLVNLETQLLNRYAEDARRMILEKDYPSLERVYRKLLSEEWTLPPKGNVINKIRTVLSEHHQKEVEKAAEECLTRINDAYSAFDFISLERALKRWEHLCETEKYQPSQEVEDQIREASLYYLSQKQIHDEENEYQRLISALQKGVSDEISLNSLESLVHKIQTLNREMPENLKKQFLAYKEGIEAIQKRRRLILVSAAGIACLILAFLAVYTVHQTIMKKKELEWSARLEDALKQNSAVTLKILEDLKKSNPSLLKRPSIVALTEKALQKKAEDDQKANAFAALLTEIRKDLKDYKNKQEQIGRDKIRLLELIVGEKEKTEYQNIEREIQLQKNLYMAEQGRAYMKIANPARNVRKNFFQALLQENLKNAAQMLNQLEEIQAKASAVRDVPTTVLNEYVDDFDDIEQLKKKLQQEIAEQETRQQLYVELQTSTTAENLRDTTSKLLSREKNIAMIQKLKLLNAQCSRASDLVSERYLLPENKMFANDKASLTELTNLQESIRKKALEDFSQMLRNSRKEPLYALVVKDLNGNYYDFYTFSKPQYSRIGNSVSMKIKNLVSENGKVVPCTIEYKYNPHFEKIENVELKIANKKKIYELIYPKKFVYNGPLDPPPNLLRMQQILEDIEASTPNNIEVVLIKAIRSTLQDKMIGPLLRFVLVKKILSYLLPDQKNPTYQKFDAALKKITIPQTYNWLQTWKNASFHKNFTENLESQIAKLPLEDRLEPQRKYYEIALSRKLTPLGYMKRSPDALTLIPFPNLPEYGEIWSFRNDAKTKIRILGKTYYHVLEFQKNDKMLPLDMEILFTPSDGRKTEELFAQYKKETENRLIPIKLPESWPNEGVKK